MWLEFEDVCVDYVSVFVDDSPDRGPGPGNDCSVAVSFVTLQLEPRQLNIILVRICYQSVIRLVGLHLNEVRNRAYWQGKDWCVVTAADV